MLFGLVSLSVGGFELNCEVHTESHWLHFERKLRTCIINGQVIATPNSRIKPHVNESTEGLKMEKEKETKYLPEKLADSMPYLNGVEFSDCGITSIGDHFKGLSKLDVLLLPHNRIENIKRDAFVDNVRLTRIDLEGNKLKLVNNQHFRSLKYLVVLTLNDNEIEFVDSSAFENLINLEYLEMHLNKLTFIEAKTFRNLRNLKSLDLQANEIDSIEQGSIDGLVSYRTILLDGNICIGRAYFAETISEMRRDLRNCTIEAKLKRMQEKITREALEIDL